MVLKLFRGKGSSKAYPMTAELLRFGSEVCGVTRPGDSIVRIAEGLSQTLAAAKQDQRIPALLLQQMEPMWDHGQQHAREVTHIGTRG